MPTVFRAGPYRFFFYSGDGVEPPHVHVQRDDFAAKIWLDPIRLEESTGFRAAELLRVQRIAQENQADLIRKWNEYFGTTR